MINIILVESAITRGPVLIIPPNTMGMRYAGPSKFTDAAITLGLLSQCGCGRTSCKYYRCEKIDRAAIRALAQSMGGTLSQAQNIA